MAWGSVADWAIVPLQDLLNLPTEARMNYPGRPDGNWRWRVTTGQVTPELVARLGDLTAIYGRR
jgi:4-alpha-glucanotransferase